MATYDWLQAYDAASHNIYGEESSKQLMNDIINGVGPDYQKALDAGIVVGQGGPVNWSAAPKPVMGDLQGNVMANSVGGRFGFVNPWSKQPTASITGNYYNDPNYGMQALVQKRAPNSPEMNLLRAGAIAMATGPMVGAFAPYVASATGMSPAFSQLLMKLLIGQGSNVAQGGSINPGGLAGSAVGGYFGGSTGSAAGSLLGSLLSGR